MEGTPPGAGEQDAAQQSDLLEVFADREVTVFGITGTFSELARMCPVDLSDPRVTLEAKNDFVVKAANSAGLEIDQAYEPIFAATTERLGLERKFTLAEPAREDQPSVIERQDKVIRPEVDSQDPRETLREILERPQAVVKEAAALTETVQPLNDLEAPIRDERQSDQETVHPTKQKGEVHGLRDAVIELTEQAAEAERRQLEQVRVVLPAPKFLQPVERRKAAVRQGRTPAHHPDHSKKTTDISVVMSAEARVPEKKAAAIVPVDIAVEVFRAGAEEPDAPLTASIEAPEAESWEGLDLFDVLQAATEIGVPAGDLARVPIGVTESLPVWLPETVVPEAIIDDDPYSMPVITFREALVMASENWAEVLTVEPAEICETFSEVLADFAELSAPLFEAEAPFNRTLEAEANIEVVNPQEVHPLLVVVTVAERLIELPPEDKEAVGQIIKNVIGAIHGIYLLETDGAPVEEVAAVEVRLEALSEVLFEALGIEYDEEKVKQFARNLRNPACRPHLIAQSVADLERLGTREAKFHFPRLQYVIAALKYRLERMLGKFTLWCTQVRFGPLTGSILIEI